MMALASQVGDYSRKTMVCEKKVKVFQNGHYGKKHMHEVPFSSWFSCGRDELRELVSQCGFKTRQMCKQLIGRP